MHCAAQTFSQYLATLSGRADQQTALHSTLASNNIAGLYKQQTSPDQFQVGSPSGSVYWTAGVPELSGLSLPYPGSLRILGLPACLGASEFSRSQSRGAVPAEVMLVAVPVMTPARFWDLIPSR